MSWACPRHGIRLNSADLAAQLPDYKRNPATGWLDDAPSDVLSQKLRNLDGAFGNFFAGRARYPRCKKREEAQTVRFAFDPRHVGKRAAWDEGDLVLP